MLLCISPGIGCTRSASRKNQSSRRASKALETGVIVPDDRFGYKSTPQLSAEQSSGGYIRGRLRRIGAKRIAAQSPLYALFFPPLSFSRKKKVVKSEQLNYFYIYFRPRQRDITLVLKFCLLQILMFTAERRVRDNFSAILKLPVIVILEWQKTRHK